MEMRQVFKVTKEWLTGPLRGSRSVALSASSFKEGTTMPAPSGRYRILSVEPVTVSDEIAGYVNGSAS